MVNMNNNFDFSESEKYNCKVSGYISTKSQLQVEMVHTETSKRLYLLLLDVVCFSGPMHWKGAKIQKGSIHEKKQILKSIHDFNIKAEDVFQEYQLLIINPTVANCSEAKFKVVAAMYSISEQSFLENTFRS